MLQTVSNLKGAALAQRPHTLGSVAPAAGSRGRISGIAYSAAENSEKELAAVHSELRTLTAAFLAVTGGKGTLSDLIRRDKLLKTLLPAQEHLLQTPQLLSMTEIHKFHCLLMKKHRCLTHPEAQVLGKRQSLAMCLRQKEEAKMQQLSHFLLVLLRGYSQTATIVVLR